MSKDVYIQVVVTNKRLFRARVTPKDSSLPRYEVTVGGKSWSEGKGKEHKDEILSKMESTIIKLQHELNEAK